MTVDFANQASFPAPYNVDPTEGDTFIARWTGYVRAPVTGSITFQTITDDGTHLNVNGTVVINQWILQGPTPHQGSINLLQDGWYAITFHMYENGGGVAARLLWSYPGQATFVVIPSTHLSSTPPPPPATPTISAAQSAGFTNSADVSWTNSGAGVTYDLQRSENGGAFATVQTGVAGLTYTDSPLNYNSNYCYQVRAVQGNLMSPYSTPACVTINQPPPRTDGHSEGLFDENCSCGSTIQTPWASGVALLALALAALRRRVR
ncbi:MAG TPA: PA14 domain-containing protein [Planctomycetota bacterium]